MAGEEKPYRVYKGGRAKGKVPAPARPERPARRNGRDGERFKGPGPRRPRRRWSRRRIVAFVVVCLVALLVVWGVASFLAFRSGVADAHGRLPADARQALDRQSGLLLSHATTILLLGTDHSAGNGRATDEHSDSIMLVHSDPDRHRIVYLSLPRDLYVPIPGYGSNKINAAYQIGGPALAIRTVREFTGLDVDHVAIVDFADFQSMIDALGGITVDNPEQILSNRFDCPYPTETRCQQWQGWRFAKGDIHLDGHEALIYSRVRENRLNAADTDITRGERQQAVMQAVASKLSSIGTLVRMPWIGTGLLKPVATDLSAGQFLQLGWMKVRGHTLHCRLGGDPETLSVGSVLSPDERNREVLAMVTGKSAPQPPPPGQPYEGGCTS